jgi:hypothetical protein
MSKIPWKIDKNKKVLSFKANFTCCAGFSTYGYYQTEMKPNGKHILHMLVTLKAA